MLAIFANEIFYNHCEIELELFSLWCFIHFWLVYNLKRSHGSLLIYPWHLQA